MLQGIAQWAAAPVDELVDVEFPDVELPDVEAPDVELPELEPPELELPELELPELELSELAGADAGVPDEPESLADPDELVESPAAVLAVLELLEPEPPRLSVL